MAQRSEFPDAAAPRDSATPASPRAASRVLEQRFSVAHEYPVVFDRGVLRPESRVLDSVFGRFGPGPFRVMAVVDSGLLAHWPTLLGDLDNSARRSGCWQLSGEPQVVVGGEACKNDPVALAQINAQACELGLDRHSFILVIGGGAVLDVAGFAAATLHRGVRLLRMPTTVLAQNDGGVGVKNGINAFGSKNFLGSFAPPAAVVCDFDFLQTLSPRDRVAGMAEAVKVALIRDGSFFDWLEHHAEALARFEPAAVEYLIERTAELHLAHIATSGDPFESKSARPLDYGHWIAHKLESLTDHELRHGEAVAIGMAVDTCYSEAKGLLDAQSAQRVRRLLRKLSLPIHHPALGWLDETRRPRFLSGLEEFRQHLGGRLSITLLTGIGRELQIDEIDEALLLRQVERLSAWS